MQFKLHMASAVFPPKCSRVSVHAARRGGRPRVIMCALHYTAEQLHLPQLHPRLLALPVLPSTRLQYHRVRSAVSRKRNER
jgi:hypothetical protein